jgi:hypothetical protein
VHDLAALNQRQAREIAALENEEIKNEVVNVRCGATEVLEQIEVWPT